MRHLSFLEPSLEDLLRKLADGCGEHGDNYSVRAKQHLRLLHGLAVFPASYL